MGAPDSSANIQSPPRSLTGSTVLLVDADRRVRDGLGKLLHASGANVIEAVDGEHALQHARGRSISAAVIDVDTPRSGIPLLHQLKRATPATAVIMLSNTRSFDLVVDAWHAGAEDVVLKTPENVKYLVDKLIDLCRVGRKRDRQRQLLTEVLNVHEQFLQRMIDATRKASNLAQGTNGTTRNTGDSVCNILFVDDNPTMGEVFEHALGGGHTFRVVSALSGGEALEQSSRQAFQVAILKSELPDLGTTMLAAMLEATQHGCVVLVHAAASGGAPGRLDLFEHGQLVELLPEMTEANQLVEQVRSLWDNSGSKSRERDYLRTFREEHDDFLRNYVQLRRRLVEALGEGR